MVHYELGLLSSQVYNMDTQKLEYNIKVQVSEDVIAFLEQHDVVIHESGKKVYIMNNVEYINLGWVFDTESSKGRRSGKTTRLVDKAIQVLFNTGRIILPSKEQVDSGFILGYNHEQIIVDPDYQYGNQVRQFLMQQILGRLNAEHHQLYSTGLIITQTTIKLK